MDLTIYMGPAWEKWTPDIIDKGGIGGSEGGIIQLSRKLSRYGFKVTVLGDVPNEIIDQDVTYLPHDSVDSIGTDILLCYRTIFPLTMHCKIPVVYNKVYVWATDVGIQEPPEGFDWNRVNGIWGLSKWHIDYMAKQQSMPKNKLHIVPLTANPTLYEKIETRHPHQAFYSSCPSRGLITMLEWSQEILRYIPEFKLAVCNNFTTIDGITKQRNNPSLLKEMNRTKELLHQPFVKYYGRLGHRSLAKIQKQSQIWMYGTSFEETYCITSQEAGLARNAIITSRLGALPDTVGGGGIYAGVHPSEPGYKEKFIEEMIRLFTDKLYKDYWQERAYQEMITKPTWGQIANMIWKLTKD